MNIYIRLGKFEASSSEELIRKALKDYNDEQKLGLSFEEIEKEEILRTEKGKPYLKNISLDFSVSHSGKAWVCALGNCKVGIDIQMAKDAKTIEVAKRFFTKEEADFITGNDSKSFFQIWTRKEAFVKYIGEGISYGFDKFSVIKNGEFNDNLVLPVKCHMEKIEIVDGYECCICTKEKENIWIRNL